MDFIEVLNITDALEIDPHYIVTSTVAYRAKVKTKMFSSRSLEGIDRKTQQEENE